MGSSQVDVKLVHSWSPSTVGNQMLQAVSSFEQSVRRMGECCSRSQGRRNHRSLTELNVGRTRLARVAGVDLDAIRALGRERHSHCNQLLVFDGNRSLGDGSFVKS